MVVQDALQRNRFLTSMFSLATLFRKPPFRKILSIFMQLVSQFQLSMSCLCMQLQCTAYECPFSLPSWLTYVGLSKHYYVACQFCSSVSFGKILMLTCVISIKVILFQQYCAWSEMLLYCCTLTRWFKYTQACIKKTFAEASFIIFCKCPDLALRQLRGCSNYPIKVQLGQNRMSNAALKSKALWEFFLKAV